MVICPYCGSPSKDISMCTNCGKRLSQSDHEQQVLMKNRLNGSLAASKNNKETPDRSDANNEPGPVSPLKKWRLKGKLVETKSLRAGDLST